jgi:hypothetical protein
MKIDTRYSLAVLVLALLGAGCANEPQQTGQAAAVQPAKVAATSPLLPRMMIRWNARSPE